MGIDTTWSATQVGRRPVESGLGGHEEGVGGVDDGVENASLPLWKQVGITLSECAPFSDFIGVANDVVDEKHDVNNIVRHTCYFFETHCVGSSISVAKEK